MAKYVGKRIVPKHCGVWDSGKTYEMESVVYDRASGNSFISRKAVPAGTDISQAEYWALCSDFNMQMDLLEQHVTASEARIRADNDATEAAIRADNDETEAAIRADNQATREHVDESLEETTENLTQTVTEARTAMTRQKEEFDQTAEQLNTRMDAVLAEGTGDGQTEILDARVDADGNTFDTLGAHVRSIRGKALEDTKAYFSESMDTFYNRGILREVNQALHKGELYYAYVTSTFSGWVSEYTIPDNTIAMGIDFYLTAREDPITKVRVSIAVDERNEEHLVFRKIMDVNIEPATEQKLTCELPSLRFEAGQTVYIAIDADVICSSGFGKGGNDGTVSWYTTYGSFPGLQGYSNGTIRHLYVDLHGYVEGEFIAKDLQEISDDHEARLQTVESWRPLVDTFEEGEVYADHQTPFPIASNREMYNSSTFIGWAFPMGKLQKFDTMIFTIKNRSTTEYLDKVRCVVTKQDRAGITLADETMEGFHIAPGEWRKIEFLFSEPVRNDDNEELYVGIACNGYFSFMGGYCGVNLNPPEYGFINYLSADSNFDTKMNLDLSRWQKIYDPNGYCDSMIDIIFALRKKKFTLGGFRDEVREIAADEIEKDTLPPRVILPDVFHAVVGDTLQLFYRGMVEHPYPYFYNIDVKCDIGKNTVRYYEVTPDQAKVGDHTLTVTLRDHRDRVLTTAQTILRVHAVGNSPTLRKNILCVGDSLTGSGVWCKEAQRRLTESGGTPGGLALTNIRFIGTKKNGACGYEGYGGWTWASYLNAPATTTLGMWVYGSHDKDSSDQHSLWEDASGNLWSMETIEADRIKFTRYQNHTAAMPIGEGTLQHYQNATHTEAIHYSETVYAEGNPFWDSDEGQVNFRTYCERNGFDRIDCMVTLLSWNGMAASHYQNSKTLINTHVTNAKRLIRILHEQYPNAKVKMMGIQLPSVNGGTGNNYGANSQYSNWYGLVRAVMQMNLAYQEMANDDEFKDYVEFINISGQFDSENNMPQQARPVNTRSSTTEMVGTNGVHPTTNGYYQIGDAAFRALIPELTE